MRETILKIRTFDIIENKFVRNPRIKYDSPKVIYSEYPPTSIITHYSGVNDSNGKLIYEGDIIKLSGKANVAPYVGVVFMQRNGINNKEFILKPAWKIVKSENIEISSDTEYFITIEATTSGKNRIHGHFLNNDYPINEEKGTGFSNGTISEVIGNIFENKDKSHCEIKLTGNFYNPFITGMGKNHKTSTVSYSINTEVVQHSNKFKKLIFKIISFLKNYLILKI